MHLSCIHCPYYVRQQHILVANIVDYLHHSILYKCSKENKNNEANSEDVTKAMISQAIYPLGLVMIILFVLALALGGKKKKRKR